MKRLTKDQLYKILDYIVDIADEPYEEYDMKAIRMRDVAAQATGREEIIPGNSPIDWIIQ